MIKRLLVVVLLLTAFCLHEVDGQRFAMGFNAGTTLSQLDGDGYTGYDKLGFRLGIRSQTWISEKVDFIIELNWEEKGSRFESDDPEQDSKIKNREIALAYAEVPLLFRFYHRQRSKIFFEAGAAIAYLVNNRFTEESPSESLQVYRTIADQFNRSEWNLLLGGGFAFGSRTGILFRTSIGVSHLYRDLSVIEKFQNLPAGSVTPIVQLRNYLMSIAVYHNL